MERKDKSRFSQYFIGTEYRFCTHYAGCCRRKNACLDAGVKFETHFNRKTNMHLPRKELYYRYYEYPIDHYVIPHLGIREKQYKLIYFYTANEWEFYDLKNDPGEKKNLITAPKHKKDIDRMKKRLNEVRREYDDIEAAGILKGE